MPNDTITKKVHIAAQNILSAKPSQIINRSTSKPKKDPMEDTFLASTLDHFFPFDLPFPFPFPFPFSEAFPEPLDPGDAPFPFPFPDAACFGEGLGFGFGLAG